jgi:phosphoribosyl-AMP cyclohydrolase
LVADFKLREKLMQTSAENSKNKDSKGFVFFSLLLVLSGAVCLHFGLETAESSQELAETSKKDIDELAKVVSSANENLESRAEVLEEMAEFYFCKSCQREFSKGGYTGHFRHHKTCEKGNFDIVKKPVKSKLSQLKLSL